MQQSLAQFEELQGENAELESAGVCVCVCVKERTAVHNGFLVAINTVH